MPGSFHDRVTTFLGQLRQSRHLREAQPLPGGLVQVGQQTLVDFSSNDYLGLSHDSRLITAAQQWAERYGAGATASRLITGNHPESAPLESKIAHMKRTSTALLMNSGFSANSTVLAALLDSRLHGGGTGKQTVNVLTDRLVHASIHFGIAASGVRQQRFHHNDLEHLSSLLQKCQGNDSETIIVTESVFSMDGDCADIPGLRELAERFDALLYIDEAHATGVLGPQGAGLTAETASKRFDKDREVVIGTFGKALGSYGAYVACSQPVRDYLINRCSGLIYATALPPSVLGSIYAALELLPALDNERRHLQELAAHFRQRMKDQCIDTGGSSTQIVPVVIGDDDKAMSMANELQNRGFLVGAIRPPTVPAGTSRLRITFSAAHARDQVDALANAIAQVIS